MPIPRSLIRKLADDNAVYTDALSLALSTFEHKIIPTEFDGFFHVVAHFPDGADTKLQIDNLAEVIEEHTCTCSKNRNNDKPCKHIAALLLKIENDFFSADFARNGVSKVQSTETSPMLQNLMERRAASLKASAARRAGAEKAMIIPFLKFESGRVRLSFKAGSQKAYVIKDLSEFHALLQARTIAPCGKAESFLYIPENFDDSALVHFFLEYYPLCRDENDTKSMLLSPIALDRFANIYQNKKLTFTNDTLTFLPQPPALSLSLRRAKDFYRLNLSRTDFELYHGQNQLYVKENELFYLCGPEFSEACADLLECFTLGVERPCVHIHDMQAFYSMVLKPASRFIEIRSEDKDFIPPALKTKIYLDVDKKKTVTAKVEFSYGGTTYRAFDPERDLQSVWDIEGETAVEEMVRFYFPLLDENGIAYFTNNDEQLYLLVTEGISTLSEHAKLFISADLRKVRVRSMQGPRLGVRIESDLLQLNFTADDMPPHLLAAALSAYKQKKKYIRLENGTFLNLETESMKQFSTVADNLGLTSGDIRKKDLALPLYRSLYLDTVTDIRVDADSSFQQFCAGFKHLELLDPVLPKKLANTLRDYQKNGYKWLHLLTTCGFGGILADDMGLGKTLQILTLFSAYKEKNKKLSALVVCPASLVLNWENEVKRFTPELCACCVIGTSAERSALLQSTDNADIYITSYDLLKRDADCYQKLSFDFEVIDEAQYIKNHNTQNAKAVKAIQATHHFALTGTPIENGLSELWSIFDYLMPGYLYKYNRFRHLFEQPIVKDGDNEALRELKKLTSPFILRRLKRDVLKELPEKTETTLYTNLAQEQRTLYAANLASMHKELSVHFENQNAGSGRMLALSMLTRLRQLCCDPSLLYENYKEESAKLELCTELIEGSVKSGHKLLVFSQFTSMLAILEKRLKHLKIPYYLIEGATKKEDRIAMVNAFNQDDTPVFLISLKAGGTGLNLTGADIVIHYDPWWNLSALNQATDRAHRIGQKKNVQVYKLIAKNTVEEKILALASKKYSLAENVLPDENNLLSRMTKEELLDLFK